MPPAIIIGRKVNRVGVARRSAALRYGGKQSRARILKVDEVRLVFLNRPRKRTRRASVEETANIPMKGVTTLCANLICKFLPRAREQCKFKIFLQTLSQAE